MIQLLQILVFSLTSINALQIILMLAAMIMIFQVTMNKFYSSIKVCKVKNMSANFENDMWAIE